MPDAPSEPPRRPVTLDLSTGPGRPGKRPRKGPPPVIVQTINLSTPKPTAPPAAPPAAERPTPPAGGTRRDDSRRDDNRRGDGTPRNRSEPTRGGTSLADLLDDATLARLRGGT